MKRIIFLFLISITHLLFSQGQLNIEWNSKGPDNVGGYTKAILWDNKNEDILYAAGIASGLFKSTNKGQYWSKIESYDGNNTSVNCISQSTNGTLFVGTGNNNFNQSSLVLSYSFMGNGIYKSHDQGNTWTHLTQTAVDYLNPVNKQITNIANHPINDNIMIYGTKYSTYISLNAQSLQPTFTQITGINLLISDIKFTEDGKDAFIVSGSRIYKSTDSTFLNFVQVNTFNINASSLKIALSAVDNNGNYNIYASVLNTSQCLKGIYKSENKGISWTQLAFPSINDPFLHPEYNNCHGYSSHTLAVNPKDKNKLYIGGITLYTWDPMNGMTLADDISNENASNYTKAHKHNIVFNPHDSSGNEMIIAGDGGLFYTRNALNSFPDNIIFEPINNNYKTILLIKSALGKNGDILISSPFNGTRYLDYKTTSPFLFEAKKIYKEGNGTSEISNYNESVFLFCGNYGSLRKTDDYGVSYHSNLDLNIDPNNCNYITCNNTFDAYCNDIYTNQKFQFFTYFNESSTSSKLFVPTLCQSKLYIQINPISNPSPLFNSIWLLNQDKITSMDGSFDRDRLAAVTSNNKIIIIDNLNSFTPSIPDNTSTNTSQLNINYIDINNLTNLSGISIDKNNKNHLLICTATYNDTNKISKSLDGGQTWIPLQNNLPIMPIYDCVIDKGNSNKYILATERGIWASDDAGLTWQLESAGMGQVPVYRIRQEWVLEEACDVLLATTAGNGVYTSTTLTNCNKDIDEEIWAFTSISDKQKEAFNLKVFPNPSDNYINVNFEIEQESHVNIYVYDILSKECIHKELKQSSSGEKRIKLDISSLEKGSYFLVTDINGIKFQNKIIKK